MYRIILTELSKNNNKENSNNNNNNKNNINISKVYYYEWNDSLISSLNNFIRIISDQEKDRYSVYPDMVILAGFCDSLILDIIINSDYTADIDCSPLLTYNSTSGKLNGQIVETIRGRTRMRGISVKDIQKYLAELLVE